MLASICVPCYNRPEMVRELLESVMKQTYPSIEVVLSDDSTDEKVEEVAQLFQNRGLAVRYLANRPGLGYARNLRQALLAARGEIVIILGDDDVFAHPDAVARYVSAFREHPNVGYVYSNQIQFSETLGIDKIFRYFPKDALYRSGRDAFEHIWATAVFIPGIAFRNSPEIEKWYPKAIILFPQLELVGHIIARHDAFAIAAILVGGRAHAEQLGFHAIRGDRVTGNERHGALESIDILNELIYRYGFSFTSEFLEDNLIRAFSVTLLKERLVVGRELAKANYLNFIRASEKARKSRRLRLSYFVMSVVPGVLLNALRTFAIRLERLKSPAEFARLERQLQFMVHPEATHV